MCLKKKKLVDTKFVKKIVWVCADAENQKWKKQQDVYMSHQPTYHRDLELLQPLYEELMQNFSNLLKTRLYFSVHLQWQQ